MSSEWIVLIEDEIVMRKNTVSVVHEYRTEGRLFYRIRCDGESFTIPRSKATADAIKYVESLLSIQD